MAVMTSQLSPPFTFLRTQATETFHAMASARSGPKFVLRESLKEAHHG
jgi:hypothetical protein